MYEVLYNCAHIDARGQANMRTDVNACERLPLHHYSHYTDVNKAIDSKAPIKIVNFKYGTVETWHWKGTCQCQSRDYHFYSLCDDYKWEPPETVIIRQIDPDLHANLDITEQKRKKTRLQFTYTLSGNLICELDMTATKSILPSEYDLERFVRNQLGLTNQQKIFLHFGPTMTKFLAQEKLKTTS